LSVTSTDVDLDNVRPLRLVWQERALLDADGHDIGAGAEHY
jgi:hypothetical protein